jgi:hypothetical protein
MLMSNSAGRSVVKTDLGSAARVGRERALASFRASSRNTKGCSSLGLASALLVLHR